MKQLLYIFSLALDMMSVSQVISFVFTLLLFSSVHSSSYPDEVCDFADVKCWTSGVKLLYKTIVAGVEGLVAPMDPLNIDSFIIDIPDLINVKAINATFFGLTHCSPILLKFRENEYKYDYILRCPKLILKSKVTVNAGLGAVQIDNCDTVTITAEEYLVKARGKYGVFIAHDQSTRFYLEEFVMDTEPQGPITLETENKFGLSHKQSVLAEHYLKKNWTVLEKTLRYPAMYLFMLEIVREGDVYLRATPREYIFPKLSTCHESCDISKDWCITKVARFVFSNVLSGVKGLLDPIEPFVIAHTTGETLGFKYELINATFTNIKSCIPEEKLNVEESSYEYNLHCSHLVLNAFVEAKGRIGPIYVDGYDYVTIIADGYNIGVLGYYGIFVDKEDHSKHFYLKDYVVDTEPRGRISFKSNNIFGIPKNQSHRAMLYMRHNWRNLEKLFRYPIIDIFANKILNNIDIFLKATPIDKLIPKY